MRGDGKMKHRILIAIDFLQNLPLRFVLDAEVFFQSSMLWRHVLVFCVMRLYIWDLEYLQFSPNVRFLQTSLPKDLSTVLTKPKPLPNIINMRFTFSLLLAILPLGFAAPLEITEQNLEVQPIKPNSYQPLTCPSHETTTKQNPLSPKEAQ
jgi:hypothetical protein